MGDAGWYAVVAAFHRTDPGGLRAGNRQMRKIPYEEWIEVVEDGTIGFCLACGEEAWGVEPDARKYECEGCGRHAVYGAEEIGLMGLVDTGSGEVADA